mmetsp:Transcript_116717/g.363455  ORF Transcript_116717/g.363455 Transcript_116717/m.363455 type:complete len:177 (+) Transcript_116717:520-1050(+)
MEDGKRNSQPYWESRRVPGGREVLEVPQYARLCYKSGMRTSIQVIRDPSLWADSAEAIQARLDLLLPEFSRSMREEVLVSFYEPGGYYTPHWDGRRCTVILYANDEGSGGATYFPVIDLRVERKAGRAVVFFPRSASNFNKATLFHTAEEQLTGEKRVLQFFIDPRREELGDQYRL